MSAHAIAAEIRSEVRAYRRRHRHGDQSVEHEAKDTFCANLDRKLADLVRAIGVPDALSFAPGTRTIAGRHIIVATKVRPSAKRAPRAA